MDSISLGSWVMDSISLYRDPRTGTKLKVTGLLGIVRKPHCVIHAHIWLPGHVAQGPIQSVTGSWQLQGSSILGL